MRRRAVLRGSDFFFSSRRRHTSCLSDWSSDVCSSDLSRPEGQEIPLAAGGIQHFLGIDLESIEDERQLVDEGDVRSEERRVGKEWIYRRSPCAYKNNVTDFAEMIST